MRSEYHQLTIQMFWQNQTQSLRVWAVQRYNKIIYSLEKSMQTSSQVRPTHYCQLNFAAKIDNKTQSKSKLPWSDGITYTKCSWMHKLPFRISNRFPIPKEAINNLLIAIQNRLVASIGIFSIKECDYPEVPILKLLKIKSAYCPHNSKILNGMHLCKLFIIKYQARSSSSHGHMYYMEELRETS